MSAINSKSSIAELIKFIRHSFRESEFDQVQNILMEKEKIMLIEMENLVKDRDLMKKSFDLLENSKRVAVSEKCSMEGKLGGIHKRCEELEKEVSQLKEKIRIVRKEKLGIEKNLESSSRKCEESEKKFAKMEKKIEELRHDKLESNQAIKELKRKEIETNGIVLELKFKNAEAHGTIDELRVKMMKSESTLSNLQRKEIETDEIVQELKLKNVEANQTIDELRAKMLESESSLSNLRRKEIETDEIVQELKLKNVEANQTIDELRAKMLESESSLSNLRWKEIENDGILQENVEANHTIDELRVKNMEFESSIIDPKILMLKLAKICNVRVEDLHNLIRRTEDSVAAANVGEAKTVNLPKVVEGLENGAVNADAGDRVVVLPKVLPTFGSSSRSEGIGFVKKGSKGVEIRLGGEVSSYAAVDVVVIESDDETEVGGATVTNKRSRIEKVEYWNRKKKATAYLNGFKDVESTDSDDESCSDSDIDNLVESLQSKRRCG